MEPLASGDRQPPGPPRPPAPPATAFGPGPTPDRPRRAAARTGPVAFLRESASTLRQVAWPSGGELAHTTGMVLVALAALVLLIVAFDFAATSGLLWLSD